jgi:thiamine pyrophosphokinase
VLQGEPPSTREIALLREVDRIVCADGGCEAVLRAGLEPSLVVGDLDSIAPATLNALEARGIAIQRVPAWKDESDGELAVEAALGMAPDELLILGAHGGRTAMGMANLGLLRRAHARGVEAQIVGRGETLRLVGPGEPLALRGLVGATFSVLPWDGSAEVGLQGTDWDHDRVILEAGTARGVSNRIRSDPAEVRVHRGLALVIVEGEPHA